MDTRRSYYLAALSDDLDVGENDAIPCADIPYVTPANDNRRPKDHPRARFLAVLRRLAFLHGFNFPF